MNSSSEDNKMELRARDIAEMMGVSTATVSLAINNKPGISKKKQQEIINKIHELHCEYLLKEESEHKGNITFTVFKRYGQIVNESPFFNYFLEGINYKLKKNGYNLMFEVMESSSPLEIQIAQLTSTNSCGLIIFGTEMQHDDLRAFKDSSLPFVVLDNAFREYDIDAVSINNTQGIELAIKYLTDNGHRKIGYIRSKTRITSFEERFTAFTYYLKKMGLSFDRQHIIDVEYSEKAAQVDTINYLQSHSDLPTAFFAENDLLGCSAMRGFKEFGYNVPDDISIIGFDNRPVTQLMHPNLATINVPKDIFGPAAVDLLLQRLEGGRTQSLKLEVGTNLIKGGTVKQIGKAL